MNEFVPLLARIRGNGAPLYVKQSCVVVRGPSLSIVRRRALSSVVRRCPSSVVVRCRPFVVRQSSSSVGRRRPSSVVVRRRLLSEMNAQCIFVTCRRVSFKSNVFIINPYK